MIDTVDGFEKALGALESSIQEDQIKIKDRKKKDPEAKAEDFKDEILSVNTRFYKARLLEQNIRNIACSITELHILAKSMDIEIELTEEREKIYDLFKEDNRDLFVLESGEVKPVDPKGYEKLENQVIENSSKKESLEKNFELI